MGSSSHKGKGREPDRRHEDRRERPEKERRRESGHSHSTAPDVSLCGPGKHFCGPANPGCFQSTEEAIIKLGLKTLPRPEPDQSDRRAYSHWEREYREWRDATCPCGKGFFCRRHAQWVSGAAVATHDPRNSDRINEPICHRLGLHNHPDDSLHTQHSIRDNLQQDSHQSSTYGESGLHIGDQYDVRSQASASSRGTQSHRHSRSRSHQLDNSTPSHTPYPDAYTDPDFHHGLPSSSRSNRDDGMGSQQGSWYHDQELHSIEEYGMPQQASTSSGNSQSAYHSSAERPRSDRYPNPRHHASGRYPKEEDSYQPSARTRGQVVQQEPYLEDHLDPPIMTPPYIGEDQIESNDLPSTPWHDIDDDDSSPQGNRSSHHRRHGRDSGSYLYSDSSNPAEGESSGYNQPHNIPTGSFYSEDAHLNPHLDSLDHQYNRPNDSSYPGDLGSHPYAGTSVDEVLLGFSDLVLNEDYRNHPSGSGSQRTKDDGKGKKRGKGKHR